ncbi:transcriptional regulator [Fischerella thermalis CCMEE 5273]|nr:transcriptional regulator [Fischerella thermalis CCMEE 5273]
MKRLRIKLDKVLDSRGITQSELSERTGITPSVISNLVNNQRKSIYTDSIETIAEELGIGPLDLLEEVDEEEFFRLQRRGRRQPRKKKEGP